MLHSFSITQPSQSLESTLFFTSTLVQNYLLSIRAYRDCHHILYIKYRKAKRQEPKETFKKHQLTFKQQQIIYEPNRFQS
jgi:hypothetical protein